MLVFARWKIAVIVGICLLGVIYAAPNFLREANTPTDLPSWLPVRTVNLGLDLQGGAHLLIEVQTAAVLKDRLTAVEETIRSVLRPARIGYVDLGVEGTSVTFRLRDPAQAADAQRILAEELDRIEISVEGDRIVLGQDESSMRLVEQAAVQQTMEVIRRRIDETGVREPTIQRQGENRIIVQLPGVGDPERIKELIRQTARLTFHLVDMRSSPEEARSGRLPAGSELMEAADVRPGSPASYVVQRRVMVSGERLVDAEAGFNNGQPIVNFRFDTLGARRFGRVTQDHVGDLLAIVLDGKVISAPRINEPILGGSGMISGSFTTQEASDLALLLRAGALPAPITYLEERTVGPGLGADSIAAGKLACIIGLLLVVAFMTASYGLFGVMANIALFFNIGIILALLSVIQATLTLPGIAGIVLTVGMAVDANVLIFERIREEMRLGRTPISAIEAGYKRALTTIIDSNLTTLIAALMLFQFGSGPVRGFAVTLAIGLMTSMFTAIWVTRLMIVTWLRRRRPQVLPI